MHRSITAAFAATAIFLAGCDSDPTGTRDEYPDMLGTYDLEQTAAITAPGLGNFTFQCDGTLTIDEQNDGTFGGTLVTEASSGCGGESLTSEFTGRVDADGDLELGDETLESTEQVAEDANCTIVSLEDPEGTFLDGVIRADAALSADCQTAAGTVRISLDFDLIARRR